MLRRNCAEFGITLYPMGDPGQGIVHVIGPEQGLTQPGMTIVCGDSHTSTHGAFGALAFGIGTSEVEHVLATQTLRAEPAAARWPSTVDGDLPAGVTAKDVILAIIGRIGTGGGIGSRHRVPRLGHPGAVDGGPHDGLQHVASRPAPRPASSPPTTPPSPTSRAAATPRRAPPGSRPSTTGAASPPTTAPSSTSDVVLDAAAHQPAGLVGHQPRAGRRRSTARSPTPTASPSRPTATRPQRALDYMGLTAGTPMRDIAVDTVFIGSCTNGRIEDLRAAAAVAEGRHVASGMRALVVPGSLVVKTQAEAEGLDDVFTAAGFEWREPGCSMCLAMNPDKLAPGERSASTVQPQLRGPPGPRRPHPPRLPRRRRRHRRRRPFAAPTDVILRIPDERRTHRLRNRRCRSTAPTSTPTRSSPPTG